jgi:CDP-glucose 4,6-dehydratase
MLDSWGSGSWVHETQQQPHEAAYLKLDCSKARSRLSWMPRWTLGNAVEAIVDWQRAYLRGDDMRVFTLSQIACFEEVSA